MKKRETRAIRRIESVVRMILSVILLQVFYSPRIMASPVDDVRKHLYAVRTSPSQVEMAGLPNGCSEDRLVLFRQNGKIVRVHYDTHDNCAIEQSFQLEQVFDSAGLPIYVAFRYCSNSQNDCTVGQLYFAKQKIVQNENYRIVIEPDGYGQSKKSATATREHILLCTEEAINGAGGKNCYFASPSDVESYLKSRLANQNLEGMFATIITGRFSEAGHSHPGEWEAAINANLVRLRKDPSTTAPVLARLFPFESAAVLEKGIEERVPSYGSYPWYRVKIDGNTGWIFGAFLDPVPDEKMLENVEITRWLSSGAGEKPRSFKYSRSFSPEPVVCSTSGEDSSVTCSLRLNYTVAAKSDLNEAYLLIASGPVNRACKMEDFRDGHASSEEKKENDHGVAYLVTETEEGAMSHLYYRSVYLTYQKHRCRAVIYFFNTTNRGVIEKGNKSLRFNRAQAEAEFDRIRRSIVWE